MPSSKSIEAGEQHGVQGMLGGSSGQTVHLS